MTIRFPSRIAASCCALCVTGVLALTPAPASARTGADPVTPRAGDAGPLYRSGTQARLRPGAPRLPRDVSALSWLVADAGTGEVLAAHNAHRKLPPASTLKTLFALTVLPTLPAGLQHKVTEADLAGIGAGSSLVGVAAGRTYRVSDLWRGVFLNSGNDAVHVLAAMSGGWRDTAVRMQARARSLGARDTHVRSPDGYDTSGQVSSAYDLAVFGRTGLRNADFAAYCGTAYAKFPGGGGWSYEIQNTNRLLTGANGVERYRGVIGVKNGYTSRAGNTLVAAARRGGRTLVVTVMNPQDGGGYAVYEEARSLLDWGFGAAGRVDPVGSLVAARPVAQAGPEASAPVPVAATVASDSGPGWPETWTILGAAVLGAGAVSLVLRLVGPKRV
ncbi:D-alanyl-D-alanine carboxypeptidase [Streptomyces sp. SID12501]|uniref:D-alanyl-D-alanine carboxypeptidase n=1 Tax=Streptomyces sp. SID12501 TaxID=2706042 RepID=A0A6B3C404_9ACTN|nr:serine hydrolase [Streptomyces sp. SID12501]NEC91389.1 D-alanyl-D-alanine carboxypeptidase [Streptomyces sp. SID12501]